MVLKSYVLSALVTPSVSCCGAGVVGTPFCRDRASLSLCESIQIIKKISFISGPLIVFFYGEVEPEAQFKW